MAAAIGFQHLLSTNNDQRNRMLPSEEEGVILVLHQGQRNSARCVGRNSSSIFGDSERQILVLLNDQRRDFEQHRRRIRPYGHRV
mmetsp:Transcript_72769/g.115561  ORF Transcript_72769/g.115561 Transcript_72769/m.115561 type:complete len:85 (-) Transcript_72769:1826-2080(-)